MNDPAGVQRRERQRDLQSESGRRPPVPAARPCRARAREVAGSHSRTMYGAPSGSVPEASRDDDAGGGWFRRMCASLTNRVTVLSSEHQVPCRTLTATAPRMRGPGLVDMAHRADGHQAHHLVDLATRAPGAKHRCPPCSLLVHVGEPQRVEALDPLEHGAELPPRTKGAPRRTPPHPRSPRRHAAAGTSRAAAALLLLDRHRGNGLRLLELASFDILLPERPETALQEPGHGVLALPMCSAASATRISFRWQSQMALLLLLRKLEDPPEHEPPLLLGGGGLARAPLKSCRAERIRGRPGRLRRPVSSSCARRRGRPGWCRSRRSFDSHARSCVSVAPSNEENDRNALMPASCAMSEGRAMPACFFASLRGPVVEHWLAPVEQLLERGSVPGLGARDQRFRRGTGGRLVRSWQKGAQGNTGRSESELPPPTRRPGDRRGTPWRRPAPSGQTADPRPGGRMRAGGRPADCGTCGGQEMAMGMGRPGSPRSDRAVAGRIERRARKFSERPGSGAGEAPEADVVRILLDEATRHGAALGPLAPPGVPLGAGGDLCPLKALAEEQAVFLLGRVTPVQRLADLDREGVEPIGFRGVPLRIAGPPATRRSGRDTAGTACSRGSVAPAPPECASARSSGRRRRSDHPSAGRRLLATPAWTRAARDRSRSGSPGSVRASGRLCGKGSPRRRSARARPPHRPVRSSWSPVCGGHRHRPRGSPSEASSATDSVKSARASAAAPRASLILPRLERFSASCFRKLWVRRGVLQVGVDHARGLRR